MFAYCTERLHLSEAEAYLRITVGRLARRFPRVLDVLREGSLHLSGIVRIAPLLTPENAETLLGRAAHRTKREIEELVAELAPRPGAPAAMRRLPQPGRNATTSAPFPPPESLPLPEPVQRPASLQVVPERVDSQEVSSPSGSPSPTTRTPDRVQTLSPGRYRIQFTATVELREKLERLQALSAARCPTETWLRSSRTP